MFFFSLSRNKFKILDAFFLFHFIFLFFYIFSIIQWCDFSCFSFHTKEESQIKFIAQIPHNFFLISIFFQFSIRYTEILFFIIFSIEFSGENVKIKIEKPEFCLFSSDSWNLNYLGLKSDPQAQKYDKKAFNFFATDEKFSFFFFFSCCRRFSRFFLFDIYLITKW